MFWNACITLHHVCILMYESVLPSDIINASRVIEIPYLLVNVNETCGVILDLLTTIQCVIFMFIDIVHSAYIGAR